MLTIQKLRELIKEVLLSEVVKIKVDPEHASIEAFVQYCFDDEMEEFDHEDLAILAYALKLSPTKIRKMLEEYGFKLAQREIPKHTRGFTTSSNDRWYGPGSSPTSGGAGIDNATGRATVRNRTI